MPAPTSSPIQPANFEIPLFDLLDYGPRPALAAANGRVLTTTARAKEQFGLLEVLLPSQWIQTVLEKWGRGEKRRRLLPTVRVVYGLLLMCLEDVGYRRLMRSLQAQLGDESGRPAGRSAFGKRRQQVGWEPVKELLEMAATALGRPQTDAGWNFWRGWRVVAIDGTTFRLQANEELEKEFGGQTANDGSGRRVGRPQARLVSLLECGTRALLAVAVGRYSQGEGSLAGQLLEAVGPGMLVLADRCFPAKELWLEYTERGADLLWRVKSDIGRRVVRELPDGSYITRFGKSQPVEIRVIEYRLKPHGEVYRLFTNLLHPGTAPAQELAQLYSQRWEIELATREIKSNQGRHIVLRSKTKDLVLQEIYAYCLLHVLCRKLAYAAATTLQDDPDRISFSHTIDVIKHSLTRLRHLPRITAAALTGLRAWALVELTRTRELLQRRPRSCIRAVYRPLDHFVSRASYSGPKSTPCSPPRIILCKA